MYVGLMMLTDFVTVSPATTVKKARRMLDESGLWMLLVVEQNKLVGYVRGEDVNAALPSMMTTLEKHEANYLLSKLTVEMILRKDITVIAPEAEIETAAKIMHDKNLAGLAVVDTAGELLGYINRTVMLAVLVEEMGLERGGTRLALELEDRRGVLHEVLGIVARLGVGIISTATFFREERRIVVLRLATNDAAPVERALAEAGVALVGPRTFEPQWRKA